MKSNNTIEQEVNKVRIAIYEETKDMTIRQRRERLEKLTDPVIQRYGFRIIPNNAESIR